MIDALFAGWGEGLEWGDRYAGFAPMLGVVVFLLSTALLLRAFRLVFRIFGLRS